MLLSLSFVWRCCHIFTYTTTILQIFGWRFWFTEHLRKFVALPTPPPPPFMSYVRWNARCSYRTARKKFPVHTKKTHVSNAIFHACQNKNHKIKHSFVWPGLQPLGANKTDFNLITVHFYICGKLIIIKLGLFRFNQLHFYTRGQLSVIRCDFAI